MANVPEYKLEIRRTFALVEPIATQAAAIFYPTLWEVNPSTKVLFKDTDMTKQGEKLMKTLGIAVGMLDSMDKLVPILQILGRKHVSYGVKAEMYPSVGEALLLTLDKGLGAECTPETKAAWTWVMGVISGVCIKAAKEVDPSYGETKEKEEEEKEGKDTEAPVAAITKGKEEDTVEAPVSTVTQEADPVAEKAEEKNDKAVETVENPEETPKTAVGEQKEACPRCTACPCSE